MATLNLCFQIFMNKKNTQNLLKLQIFLFFLEALSLYQKLCLCQFFMCFSYPYTHIYKISELHYRIKITFKRISKQKQTIDL